MNDYSWNLGSDEEFIEHKATGKAHYSKNWDKAKQDAYNKAYYVKHKAEILARKARNKVNKTIADEKAKYNQWYDQNDAELANARSDAKYSAEKAQNLRKSAEQDRKDATRFNRNARLSAGHNSAMSSYQRGHGAKSYRSSLDKKRRAGRAEAEASSARGRARELEREHEANRGSASSVAKYLTKDLAKGLYSAGWRTKSAANKAKNSANTAKRKVKQSAYVNSRKAKYQAGKAVKRAKSTAETYGRAGLNIARSKATDLVNDAQSAAKNAQKTYKRKKTQYKVEKFFGQDPISRTKRKIGTAKKKASRKVTNAKRNYQIQKFFGQDPISKTKRSVNKKAKKIKKTVSKYNPFD